MIGAIEIIIGLLLQLGIGGPTVQKILSFISSIFEDPTKVTETWNAIKAMLSNVSEPSIEDMIAAKAKLREPIEPLPADDEEV